MGGRRTDRQTDRRTDVRMKRRVASKYDVATRHKRYSMD